MQALNKQCYDEIVPDLLETCPNKTLQEEDINEIPIFYQYYEGCLMMCDLASFMNNLMIYRQKKKDMQRLS